MISALRQRLAGRTTGDMLGLIGKNVAHPISLLSPAAMRRRRRDAQFDRRWGTDTSGLVNLSSLTVDPAQARHGVRYQPSSGEALEEALKRLEIEPSKWSLVDYGSGKGRIVMLAATLGFSRAIGVEFSPELCTIADENIGRFMAKGGAVRAPEIELGDAGAFEPPAGPLLAYLYNPFGPAILDRVIGRLESKASADDTVTVAYVDPRHLACFEATGRWRIISSSPHLTLLRSR